MGKLIFAFILIALGFVALRILQNIANHLAPREQDMAAKLRLAGRGALAGGLMLASLIVLVGSIFVINAGHVGVISVFGRVEPRPIHEGIHLVAPWKDVTSMSTQVQRKGDKFDAASKDLQAVHIDMIINYRLLPDRAPEVYRAVGLGYADTIIVPAEQEVLKAHTALYNASEILHQRPKLKAEVQDDLAKWLAKYGLELKEASLANIAFDPTYAKAIEAKQVQEQFAEQKRYEVLQAQRQAEIAQATAKGQADAVREAAKGEADGLRFKAAAQAEYNARVSASLTPQLVAQQWIEAWRSGGSQVPHLVGGGGQGFLLNIPLPEMKRGAAPEAAHDKR